MGEEQRALEPAAVRFDAPPLEEVVLAVLTRPVAALQAPHLGLFWQAIRDEYPKIQEVPPLVHRLEQFGPGTMPFGKPAEIIIGMPSDRRRFWFLSQDETEIVQVQRDFFAVNWKKVSGDEAYGGYVEARRPRFERLWGHYLAFLQDLGQAEPAVLQCDMTYVSGVPTGESWGSFGDFAQLVAPWSGAFSGDFLPAPEAVNVEATFLVPGHRGRLIVGVVPAIRPRDGRQAAQIQTVCRVLPDGEDRAAMLRAMDVAHDWASRGFADFTTPRMHELWRRVR